MNLLTHGTLGRGRRTAALDPFGGLTQDKAIAKRSGRDSSADYGCVDWYVYGVTPPACEARRVATRGAHRLSGDEIQ
jgi:hypothetical protein